MGKHRRFSIDRFVDKFQGKEHLLGAYVASFNGRAPAPPGTLDVPEFRKFLAEGNGEGMDDLFEGLYRVYDLCTETGFEHLVAACNDLNYAPDPDGRLPVECLSLKVRTEHEEARSEYERLKRLMEEPANSSNEMSMSFFEEARALLEGGR